MPNDDDLDFAALMRQEGVTPVANPRPAPTESRAGRPSVAQARPVRAATARASGQAAATQSQPAARASGPGAATSTSAAGRASGPGAATSASAADRASGQGAQSERAVATPTQSDRATAASASKPPASTAERDALLAERGALHRERTALLGERTALLAERDALLAERDALLARIALAERDASAAERDARQAARERDAAHAYTLAAALGARGLVGADEQTRALTLLAGGESGPALLAMLTTRDPPALQSALARRLALVCGDPGCGPSAGAAAITVEPARCEVCGGSDIQRAARGFADACARAGISRVRFVGGSPNYRTKLAALFPGDGALTVHTTAGDRRVPLSRSRAHQRGDDLTIVWGATELDHATSGAYRAEHGRVEIVAHRGIGRMLALAAERLAPA